MNYSISKSAKKVLSIVLALLMIFGTLFTANVTINVSADTSGIVFWNGSYDNSLQGSGTEQDPYKITNAEELAALAQGRVSLTAHYKVEGISAFYMIPSTYKDTLDSFTTASEVGSFFSSEFDDITNWNCSATFEGVLDGNGATIYGMCVKGDVSNGGLFASGKGGTVKNLGIEKSYIKTTNNAGAIFAQGNWGRTDTSTYSPTNSILNCVVRNCYIDATNSRGGLIGNGGYSGLIINNCLVADNFIGNNGTADSWPSFVAGSDISIGGSIYVPAVVSNSIGIGILPKAGDVNASTYKEIVNCYTTMNISYSVSNVSMVSNATAESLKGIPAKLFASSLNWATDAQNGFGYWHVYTNDYPSPLKRANWSDIVIQPVWDGTASDEFAGGTGTEEDPYIIETAEQLYKMVKDGGRIWNEGDVVSYTPAHYKVANGVTDLYLNNVQGGSLDTLKGLVNTKTAKNWTAGFNADDNTVNDLDSDGLADEAAAFIGVFDGNGVTIHGLYSTTEDSTYTRSAWTSCSGIGFVPALTSNAAIKNVNFNNSYIYSRYFQAAVLTSSFGLDNDGTSDYNGKTKLKSKFYGTSNVSIYNVSVRNAYVESASSATWTGGTGGIVASHSNPSRVTMINCLFDGNGSELITGGSYQYYNAGLFSGSASMYGYRAINCVSLGIYPMPNNDNVTLSYLKNIGFTNSYTDVAPVSSISFVLEAPITITSKDIYTTDDMPLLNWGIWSIKSVENSREIPFPGVTKSNLIGYSSIKDIILENVGGAGNYNYTGANQKGTYGLYHKLVGNGTAEDPYLIRNVSEFVTALSTGGVNISNKLHYKLACDINLGSIPWLDTESVNRDSEEFYEYLYVPFEGVLDGDGHTIYELNAAADNSGALIPMLSDGTIRNLHVRNSITKTAVFASGTGTIENCSAENCHVIDGTNALVTGGASAKNSYFNDTYYLGDGTIGTPTLDGVTWYGIEGKSPKLVCYAKALPCADVNGDGIGESYGAEDLAALKNKLLRKTDYQYAYGDVNGDGLINSGDLAILIRATSNDYKNVKDGFWRNLELGNFKIYYGENDNYDAARKLELHLESLVEGLDIIKAVSAANVVSGKNSNKDAVYRHANDIEETPDGTLDIIIGNVASYSTELTGNNYGITYDWENGVLWIQGANFTAIEQATLDFIDNSDINTNFVYTVQSEELIPEKQPKTINGKTYYYTWGDEFDGIDNTINEDSWQYVSNISETINQEVNGISDGGKYMDLEMAFNKDFHKLFTVNDGVLTMRRGVYKNYIDEDTEYSWGWVGLDTPSSIANSSNLYAQNYVGDNVSLGSEEDSKDVFVDSGKIVTQNSLLVKQGYFEFMAALPSDGHSFPAWWMMGDTTGGNNNAYTESLFSKVYKINPNYSSGNILDPDNFTTSYKYQLPNAYFEFDMIELMQDISNLTQQKRYNRTTAIYDYDLTSNIHKYYTNYSVNDEYCYVVNWDNGTKTMYTLSSIDSGAEPNFIVSSEVNSHAFAENTSNFDFIETGHEKLTAMRRYGFEWNVEDGAYELALYIFDPDGDGETENDYVRYVLADSSSNAISYNEGSGPVSDLDVVNQYMYFLIDNKYYTANQYFAPNPWVSTYSKLFTDLLTYENQDKTTFEIDYLRVYQQEGKRDIVTPETENFNNGNHFGY